MTCSPHQIVTINQHLATVWQIKLLLQKFYLPNRGKVLVDGHDLMGGTSHSLASQMGSVQQNNYLFTGSVMDNIRLGRPDATEEEVRAALKALDCLDMIEALPQG